MQLKYFDAHTHTQFASFGKDYKEVIGRAFAVGAGLINIGTQKETSLRAIEIAHEFEKEPVYAAVGLHPTHTTKSYYDPQEIETTISNSRELEKSGAKNFLIDGEEFDYEYYKKLALDPKVVAIGECGLDYFRFFPSSQNDPNSAKAETKKTKEKQKEVFIQQIKLAHEVKKPLMIHCRHAFPDLIEILAGYQLSSAKCPGVIHFFSGTKSDAQKLLDMGFYFTFGGVITFAREYDEVIKTIPLDRILSETDAPYVTPAPYRGKRNEPAYVIEVVKKLADLKRISVNEMANQILKNTEKIFNLKL